MSDTCFVIDANKKFWGMAEECKKSILYFHPECEVFLHPYTDSKCVASQDDDYKWENDPGRSYDFIIPYFSKYERVVHMNADMLMVNSSPDLWGDYEFGCTRNNINLNGSGEKPFMQNGLMVVTNPGVFKEMTRLNKAGRNGGPYYDMYSANNIFYSGKYKSFALSFKDKVYGVEENDFYGTAVRASQEPNNIHVGQKVVHIFHFSGPGWKSYQEGKIYYDHFPAAVQERIKEILK